LAESPSPLRSIREPAAASTPGSRSTRSSSDSGIVALPLADPATIWRPEMTTLVFSYEASKTLPNARSIVSVRM
jgi:hypothetical protein